MAEVIAQAAGFVVSHMVSVAILVPMFGAAVSLVVPGRMRNLGRLITVAASFVCLALCVAAFAKIRGTGELELSELAGWIPSLGVYYRVGLDGASALMACTAALIATSAIVYSWQEIDRRQNLFNALALLCEASLVGLFAAADAFLFYAFWNVAVMCACFMAGIWGGKNRLTASFKLAAFAAASSAAMLTAFAYAGGRAESFCIVDWMAVRFTVLEQAWLFGALAFAFGIFVPLAGLHTWLSDFSEEAPSSCAMIFGSTMLAAGAYGLFRIAMPLAPVAVAVSSSAMLSLSTAAVFFGAMLAISERDARRAAAAASISQMGLVTLGLFSLQGLAASGAMLLAAAQAVVCAALYAISGMLRTRVGTCSLNDVSGLGRGMPAMAAMLALLTAAVAGVPGLSGFAGQFPLMLGSFQSRTAFAGASLAGLAVLWIAMILFASRAIFGQRSDHAERRFADIRAAEATAIAPLIAAVLIVGVCPQFVLGRLEKSSEAFVKLTKRVEMIIPAPGALNE